MSQTVTRPDGISLLSILFFILAAFAIIGGVFIAVGSDSFIDFIEEEGDDVPTEFIDFLDSFLVALGAIAIIFGIFYIVVGWGLWTMKSWARIVAIILAVISLLSFPVGTIIGIIVLWYLFKPEIKQAFNTREIED